MSVIIADDILDLAQGTPCRGQIAVDAGGELLDQAGAQQKLVAGCLRLGGRLAERTDKELR